MRTWTACKRVDADPAVVLDLLTDTDACRRWSPVAFDLDGEEATAALLQAGALGAAVDRIARTAAC